MLPLGAVLLLLQAPASAAPLTPFEMKKAETLLRDKLPCLGCHELGGQGGRIGPSLSGLRGRPNPAFVYDIIRDPQHALPGTIMPRVPLAAATVDLIAGYLLLQERTPPPPSSPSRPPVSGPATDSSAPALYARHCAACHGARGDGDGDNAPYLPVRPTAHSSADYMSARSDDALYDAIAVGGYIMGRSNRMPPYGETLSREQIRALVRHLRTLCACEGPRWSRDDR